MERIVKVWQLGKISYSRALQVQAVLASNHSRNNSDVCDVLLMLEHPPVYTIGIRRKDYSAEDVELLKLTGAEFHYTNRGGLITFHGPGQLVVYPVLNLKHFRISMRDYVCSLEKTVIHLCSKFQLLAATSPHTGVWIGENKVCAIGVHGSRYITTHGLALNCNTNLEWYKHIVPCGIKDKGVTSLSLETKEEVTIEEVVPEFMDSFSETFNCLYVDMPEAETKDILNSI